MGKNLFAAVVFAMLAIVVCAFEAGCSAGGSTPLAAATPAAAPVPPSPIATATALATAGAQSLTIVSPGSTSPSAASPAAIVLYRELFLDFFHDQTTAVVTDAATGQTLSGATWSVSNANVAIDPTPAPNGVPMHVDPPASGITLVGESVGSAVLTAHVGSSSVSLPVAFYPSIDIGCAFRATAGIAFDPGVAQPVAGPAGFDAYESDPPGPPNSFDPCQYAGTTDPTAVGGVFHFPYGATLLSDGNVAGTPVAPGVQRSVAFPFVAASAWRNDFTQISATALAATATPCGPSAATCATTGGTIVLFKTAAGRIVKFRYSFDQIALIGPYEVSDLSPAFPY